MDPHDKWSGYKPPMPAELALTKAKALEIFGTRSSVSKREFDSAMASVYAREMVVIAVKAELHIIFNNDGFYFRR